MNKFNFNEIDTSFTDEKGVTHLDGYTPSSETGTVVGYFINGRVYYTNPEYRYESIVQEVALELENSYKEPDFRKRYDTFYQEIYDSIYSIQERFPIIVIEEAEHIQIGDENVYERRSEYDGTVHEIHFLSLSGKGLEVIDLEDEKVRYIKISDLADIRDVIGLYETIKELANRMEQAN